MRIDFTRRVESIAPIQDSKPKPFMVVHHKEFTVVYGEERKTLPEAQAWELYKRLDILV